MWCRQIDDAAKQDNAMNDDVTQQDDAMRQCDKSEKMLISAPFHFISISLMKKTCGTEATKVRN